MNINPPTIVFFDGVCNLCNNFIDFVIKRDRHKKIYFAPLQGESSQQYLKESDHQNLSSIVLLYQGQLYRQSSAVLIILSQIYAYPLIFKALLLLPEFLRNFCYNLISRNRYRLFGKKNSCRIPTESEREQFLP